MRADILPGSVFPDYELSDHTATRRKLSVQCDLPMNRSSLPGQPDLSHTAFAEFADQLVGTDGADLAGAFGGGECSRPSRVDCRLGIGSSAAGCCRGGDFKVAVLPIRLAHTHPVRKTQESSTARTGQVGETSRFHPIAISLKAPRRARGLFRSIDQPGV
jgi:hypothetical protein